MHWCGRWPRWGASARGTWSRRLPTRPCHGLPRPWRWCWRVPSWWTLGGPGPRRRDRSAEGRAQELHGPRVGQLGRLGVEFGTVRLEEPVLRSRVEVGGVRSAERLSGGSRPGGVDEVVVLGEVAQVGGLPGRVEDIAV